MDVNSVDLVLMLGESRVNPDLFTYYNTQSLILNGFKIEASIIGESHLVVCEMEEKKSFTEVLVCAPPDKMRNNLMRKFPLYVHSRFNICDLDFLEYFRYSFCMDKIGFDDQKYKPTFLIFLLTRNSSRIGKWISYNFGTKSVEFKDEIYDPVTLISIGSLPSSGLVWNSIHVYPEEKLGVFSHSILYPRK